MTIMDKEENINVKNKKIIKKKEDNKKNNSKVEENVPKKKKRQHYLLYKLISFILIIMTIITLGTLIYKDIFPIFYLVPIIIASAICLFVISFILNKTILRSWIKNIFSFFSMVIIVVEILILLFGTTTLKFLSNLTDTGYRVETFGVYVLEDSSYKRIDDLSSKKITYLSHNDEANMKEALELLKKDINYEEESADSLANLINIIETGKTDAIFLETSYADIIREEFNESYDKLKLIKTYDVVDIVNVMTSDTDITKDSFIIYISGIDTAGNVASKARSDVNILLAINPESKEILMINTPRDYHVTLASKGKKDKLTHAGIYGIEESVKTLENLYDIDIDYYGRINFTSFVKIVNALDGIKVDVPKAICEQNSNRSKKDGDLICLSKGYQTLNGEQALALARHRKTIGDRKRGENQMLILEAIINKAISPKIITKYNSILKALDDKVITNMTENEMIKFIKKQMEGEFTWNFNSISANGTNARGQCYSTGSANLSIIEPNQETIDDVKIAIRNLFNGEHDIFKGIEKDKKSNN